MRLDTNQRMRLLEALNDTFSTESGVTELARLAINKHLDQLTLAKNLPAKLDDIVSKAEDEGWLGNLLDGAICLRNQAQPLKSIRNELDPLIISEREDHYAAYWLLGDRVLVNRQPLRDALKKINDTQTGKHILVVQGPRLSGKSHSLCMIRYLQDRLLRFKIVWVDLERLVFSTKDRLIRPEDLGEAIITQMGLKEKMPKRQNEHDARWGQRFCDWLTGQIANKGTCYWIVLDSFDKTLVPQGTHDLVRELALRIETNIDQLRLILLGYTEEDKKSLPIEVFGGIEEESTSQIGDPELLDFFTNLYEQRRQQRNIDFTPSDVGYSVAAVKRTVDFTKTQYLVSLNQAVIAECKRTHNIRVQP